MEEKLYISDQALEKYGYAYFQGMEAENYRYDADNELKELEDGLLMSRDDMGNIHLQAQEDDEVFNDIMDIMDIIYIDSHSNIFNMKAICERANIGYSTYRNWKSSGYKGLSDYKIGRLVEEMKRACE